MPFGMGPRNCIGEITTLLPLTTRTPPELIEQTTSEFFFTSLFVIQFDIFSLSGALETAILFFKITTAS